MIPLSALPKALKTIGAAYVPVDPRAALQDVDDYLIGRTRESFDTRTTPDGQPWPGDATLKRTGGLFNAATAAGTIANGTLTRKTDHKLSAILQHGARRPKKRKKLSIRAPKRSSFLSTARMLKKAARIARALAAGRIIKAFAGVMRLLKRKTRGRGGRKLTVRTGPFRIPPRPFEGIGPQDPDAIVNIIADKMAVGSAK